MEPFSLQNPPVVESVIELKMVRLPAVEENFAKFNAILGGFLATHQQTGEVAQFQASGSISFGPTQPSTTTIEHLRYGYIRWNSDTRIQISLDGILLSTLKKPYVGGDHLVQQALAVLEAFRVQFPVSQLARLGWRTINRIDLPGVSISNAARLVQTWRAMTDTGFNPLLPIAHMQAIGSTSFPGLQARVTTALQADPSPDALSIVVDVDGSTENIGPDLDEQLRTLRNWKNHVFFASLNEEVRPWLS